MRRVDLVNEAEDVGSEGETELGSRAGWFCHENSEGMKLSADILQGCHKD